MIRRLPYSLVSRSLAVLLLAAAGLKLNGLNVAPFAQYGRLMNLTVQFLAVEWEIVLSIWLLTGRHPIGAWFAALLTFLAFAGVSLHLGVIGQASCGCFGALKASPWHAFAVDVTALVLLALARPDFRTLRELDRTQWRTAILRGIGRAAVVVALGAGIMELTSLAFGSTAAALARLRGERVSIQPRLVDLGSGQPGQTLLAIVEVANWTDRPVTITGGTSDCSCVVTKDLPLTLAPGEARQVSIEVRLPDNAGFFNRKAFLWTDCAGARRLLVGLTGRIDPPARESAALGHE